MSFAVLIVSSPGYPHWRCFSEVAETIHDGLVRLGHDARITSVPLPGRRHIVLGSNLLPDFPVALPRGSVLYNLEQVRDNQIWLNPAFVSLLRRHVVWDYATENVEALRSLGVEVAAVLPVSYHPGLTRIAPAPERDIDVLFVGSVNQRRADCIAAMRARGLVVEALFNSYGAERDAVIARAKLLLNLHFYDAKILEQVRISYYLANRCAVLSEISANPVADADWAQGVHFAPYEGLADAAAQLCADPSAREGLAAAGFDFIRRRSLLPPLEEALAALPEEPSAASSADAAEGTALRRNAPCFCGSGKKYKHCHGRLEA